MTLRPDTFALTALLGLLTAIGPFSVDMYLASLPDIGRQLAASPATVQLTLSVYLVAYALGQVLYGPLSDRHGRKPVLLVALAVYCLASIACAAAPNIEALLAARAFQALGSSGSIVIARAIVRDLYEGARAGRELALMGAIFALAPVIAPTAGGLLQSGFGWRSNFVVLMLIGIAAALVVWWKLPETLRQRAAEPPSVGAILAAYREILRNRAFRAYLGLIGASFGGVFVWISASPFVLQELYGLTPLGFGLAFAGASMGFLTGSVLATRIVARLGLDRTIGVGAALLATGGLASVAVVLSGSSTAIPMVIAVALYACGMGLVQPQTIAGALMPFPHRAGAASSLVGVSQMTAAAAIGAGVGLALGTSAWPLALPLAALGVLTLLLWILSRGVRAAASDKAH